MGIQGSGKGTQARKIAEKFGYQIFDTGAELRKIATTDTELGRKINEIIVSGNYVPSEYIRDTIEYFVNTHKNIPVLFDWPIRSHEQDRVIRPILGKFVVIELELDKNLAIERLLHRRIDPETGETFPESFEWNINPKTGNILTTREDDNREAIEKRISWSLNESLPLIEKWKKDGHFVHKINANQPIEKVFEEISNFILKF